jgi:hypothetical protein
MLTSRARATLSNGRLVNHISTDVSRVSYYLYREFISEYGL